MLWSFATAAVVRGTGTGAVKARSVTFRPFSRIGLRGRSPFRRSPYRSRVRTAAGYCNLFDALGTPNPIVSTRQVRAERVPGGAIAVREAVRCRCHIRERRFTSSRPRISRRRRLRNHSPRNRQRAAFRPRAGVDHLRRRCDTWSASMTSANFRSISAMWYSCAPVRRSATHSDGNTTR